MKTIVVALSLLIATLTAGSAIVSAVAGKAAAAPSVASARSAPVTTDRLQPAPPPGWAALDGSRPAA